ncbi:FAD/NAD-binding domain-containing protein [Multifurca ochricompacta]|uniref:FAD/NAD-binding domain-containing protein n=1 Tax=Multifurca ochricompacta TaxID=376703 RepID=A0AAD4LWY5_9AGAM|nr:FAD/NAD-binding domain-containing protein [Multifurca ochricompacta]
MSTTEPDFSVDEYPRRIRVVCIGAGYSGIVAGIRFTQKVPNLDLTIYEKEHGIGGTWYVNKYPGIACDIPAHCYQYTFEDNTEWSEIYASGPEILADMRRIVDKYKLMKYVRLGHELTHAAWDEEAGVWRLRITIRQQNGGEGENETVEEIEDTADVLFLGIGWLNRPKWPKEISGLRDFRGLLVHTSQWDVVGDSLDAQRDNSNNNNDNGNGDNNGVPWDWHNKAVGVIGNGSSGIQIVSALHAKVGSLVNFARSKTWLSSSFAVQKVFETLQRPPGNDSLKFTEEERAFLRDPENCRRFRRAIESELHSYGGEFNMRGSELQKSFATILAEDVKRQLSSHPELVEHFIPAWSVSCRRLTPGPGYLEALCSNNTTLETTEIARITGTGVELQDGRHHALDILICATGFDTSFQYPFLVLGRRHDANADGGGGGASAYLSLALDDFPNLFLCGGPHSAITSGSLVNVAEHVVGYVAQAVRKMQRERLRSMEVCREAVQDWSAYVRGYFPKTIYMDPCNSWFKDSEGRVSVLWPGTGLHAFHTLANPRWEDFKYKPLDQGKGRFYWLGDGQTYNQKTRSGNRVWYLDDVDVPPGELLASNDRPG